MANKKPALVAKKAYAFALARGGKTSAAKALYNEICIADPEDAEAWFCSGAVNEQLGNITDAMTCYQRAITITPTYGDAHINLGALHETGGELPQAMAHYQQALLANPASVIALFNLANVLKKQGQLSRAISLFRDAIHLDPTLPQIHLELGTALKAVGEFSEAIKFLRTALELNPGNAFAANVLGNTLQTIGELEEAISCYRRALTVNPRAAEVHNNLGSALLAQGNITEAQKCYRQAIAYRPDWAGAHSNMLLALNYCSTNAEEIFHAHQEWGKTYCDNILKLPFDNVHDTSRKIRIGYISPDFRAHSVAYFIESLLAEHDRLEFDVTCYSNVGNPDSVTSRIKEMTEKWRDIFNVSDADVINLIRSDHIDVLVDLAGHTANNRLPIFASKPAPVQVTYLGYPNTTGMRTIDYRLTDEWADPVGVSDQWYTERLLRLPAGFLCYAPPRDVPPVGPSPCYQEGFTFGSFNSLPKITPEVVSAWCAILNAVSGSRLVIKNNSLQDQATRRHYLNLFAKGHVDPAQIILLERTSSLGEHLRMYNDIDVALDTFPYNGTTTTCEALWMGVPVVTLAGSLHAGRVGLSLLTRIGLKGLVADNQDTYIRIATELANDKKALTSLRLSLRERMLRSSLCDRVEFTRSVERAYHDMWRHWCSTQA